MNNSKLLLITILTVLLLGLNSWPSGLNAMRENNSSIEENSKSAGNHAPIFIEGNEALATFIANEGLSGEGTAASPYVIENFLIDASTAHGVEIQSTDAYLIIQNCTIEGGGDSYDGIHLENVANVNISKNYVNNHNYGILLQESSTNTLSGNTANNNSVGIWVGSLCSNNTLLGNTANNNTHSGIILGSLCSNNTLSGNTVTNNFEGISLGDSSHNTLSGNTVTNNFNGISLGDSHNNLLLGNTANNNTGDGIQLVSSSTNNTLLGNTANNNNATGIQLFPSGTNNILSGNTANNNKYFGIWLENSSHNTLSGNTANDNMFSGIWLSDSNNNTLSGNMANNNIGGGISLEDSSTNTLSQNTASYNTKKGIYLYLSSNNLISGNIASYNSEYGTHLIESNNNFIYFNDIYGNPNSQAFETSDCINNHWDNGTTGNYWGNDYLSTYPNATNDGTVWNIPYEIGGDGGGIDHFPLVNAVISPEPTTTEDTTADTNDTTTTDLADMGMWFFLFISFLVSFIGLYKLRIDITSTRWPWINGEVVSHSVKYHSGGDGPSYHKGSLIISYMVAGQEYYKNKKLPTTYRYAVPEGTNIPVFFNPNRPREAVFEPGVKPGRMRYPIVALIAYLIGIINYKGNDPFLVVLVVTILLVSLIMVSIFLIVRGPKAAHY